MEKYRFYRIIRSVILTSKHVSAIIVLLAFLSSAFLVTFATTQAVSAQAGEDQQQNTARDGTVGQGSNLECGDGGVQLGVGVGDSGDNCVGEGNQNPIFEYLGGIVQFLSIGVGVVVTAMIIVGGIQYSAAGGNPQATEAAKSRISNAIIALVLYAFMVGILNFLVPGGVL